MEIRFFCPAAKGRFTVKMRLSLLELRQTGSCVSELESTSSATVTSNDNSCKLHELTWVTHSLVAVMKASGLKRPPIHTVTVSKQLLCCLELQCSPLSAASLSGQGRSPKQLQSRSWEPCTSDFGMIPLFSCWISALWWLVCFFPDWTIAVTSSKSNLTDCSSFSPKLTSLSKNLPVLTAVLIASSASPKLSTEPMAIEANRRC